MPISKNKLQRICAIYSKLMRGKKSNIYYSKRDLINYVEKVTDQEISYSSFEKDMQELKLEFDLEIGYSRYKEGYFLIDPPSIEEFKNRLFNYLKIEL